MTSLQQPQRSSQLAKAKKAGHGECHGCRRTWLLQKPAHVSDINSKALFRGLGPSLIRALPAASSTFVTFELTREYIIKHDLI